MHGWTQHPDVFNGGVDGCEISICRGVGLVQDFGLGPDGIGLQADGAIAVTVDEPVVLDDRCIVFLPGGMLEIVFLVG